jgi:hypothetical protein
LGIPRQGPSTTNLAESSNAIKTAYLTHINGDTAMPRAVKQPASTPTSVREQAFEFPDNSHLVVTTSAGIFSWDRSGVKKLFNSSKKGILAAREAKDGSQMLAVADEHVVVLHDCKRGREESWGLNGSEVISTTTI